MSGDALKAFAAVRPELGRMLAAAELPRNRRVSTEAVAEVGRQLAFRYDPKRRGYVDETVDQLADALGMARTKVLRVLPVLDALGLWVAGKRGGSRDRYGSRRIPGPELCAAAHRLGLTLSTPQTTLELGPELSAPVRSDTQELSAPVRSDTQELSAPVRSVSHGTQRTLHRNSAHFAPELSAPVRSSNRPIEPKEPPTAQTGLRAVGLAKRRRDSVIKAYAQIALTNATPTNFDAYVAKVKRTADAMPELDDYLARFPDTGASAIAAWLHGDKHSMQYQREVAI